jgi:hypothetical protein
MAHLAELDLTTKGGEAKLRALLEDLVEAYKDANAGRRLALAVWYGKRSGQEEQNLLLLYAGPPRETFDGLERQPLFWKTGSQGPPFARVHATSLDYFLEQLRTQPSNLAPYFQNWEVLYFDKDALDAEILQAFNVLTEPSGLMKGWYVDADEYAEYARNFRGLMGRYSRFRPDVGLVKTEELADFEHCRGVLHAEIDKGIGKWWLPESPDALSATAPYSDHLSGRPGYFLFQGGALYRILRFEVKTAPEYAAKVLQKRRDDRYAEVYLRAVHPSEQPAA